MTQLQTPMETTEKGKKYFGKYELIESDNLDRINIPAHEIILRGDLYVYDEIISRLQNFYTIPLKRRIQPVTTLSINFARESVYQILDTAVKVELLTPSIRLTIFNLNTQKRKKTLTLLERILQ